LIGIWDEGDEITIQCTDYKLGTGNISDGWPGSLLTNKVMNVFEADDGNWYPVGVYWDDITDCDA